VTYTLTVPEFDLPLWLWIALAALKWYVVAGIYIRKVYMPDTFIEDEKLKYRFSEDSGWDYPSRFFFWLASPVIGTVAFIAGTAATVLWPLSGGIVQPPWRWK
jgi:hypothetical protein